MTQPSNPALAALIIDANLAVAIASREAKRDVLANAELGRYLNQGYELYAPGAIVTEVLYALCQKHRAGILTDSEYDAAIDEFEALMIVVSPPPGNEASLIKPAHALGKGYGCSRSADGAYIALAQLLAPTHTTVLLTFDQELPKQAARHDPTVNVQLLVV